MVSTCSCGAEIVQSGVGRPRKKCLTCAPPKRKPVGRIEHKCGHCGEAFVARSDAKFCSRVCADLANVSSRLVSCAGCGRSIYRTKTSAAVPHCINCRRAGKAPSTAAHGTSRRYSKLGCRCAECKAGARDRMRKYTANRKAEGNPIDFAAFRARVDSACESCGQVFSARVDSSRVRFCSLGCANDAQGRADSPRSDFKIGKRARLAIYEACDWKCQLCLSPVRPDEDSNHPRYPTLDHIQPRARGGSDEPDNLRLACRQCNTRRGTNVDWVHVELAEVSHGRVSFGNAGVAV